jgi:hypothetical protein
VDNSLELRRLLDRVGCANVKLADGKLPIMAGGASTQSPVAQPLGGATVSGTVVSVDTYVNPPTKIPAIVRNLVASNVGYFIENIFRTPGMTVEGGAVLYEETFPEDLFLPADQSLAPRAPGAEAPRLGSKRYEPKVARPESWSGSIEVTDEARKRNDVIAISNQFTRAANTLANNIQETGIAALKAFVEGASRQVESPTNWTEAHAEGIQKVDPKKLPFADFALVENKFIADKAGVLPDTLIIHPDDWQTLITTYSTFGGLAVGTVRGMISDFGISNVVRTVLATKGAPYFVKAGQIGAMLFEKPLTQEYTREGTRFTDVYSLDVAPVLVAYDASAVWQLTKINE